MILIKWTVISIDVFTKYVHTVTINLSIYSVGQRISTKVKYQKYYYI